MATVEQTLLENAGEKGTPHIDIGRSIGIAFPFLDYYSSWPAWQSMDPYLKGMYEFGKEMWSKENIPDEWLNFINEVIDEKEIQSQSFPVNLLIVIWLILENNEDLFTNFSDIISDSMLIQDELFGDKEKIFQVINRFLENQELRKILKKHCVEFIPTQSGDQVSSYDARRFIEELNLDEGIVLDLGCGNGMNTLDLPGKGYQVIGIDRQYLAVGFDENWKENDNKSLSFQIADIQALPYASNSVDVVVMTSVIGHYTQEGVTHLLAEANRVIKPNGYILVGPQYNPILKQTYFSYSVLKKDNGILKEI